MRLRILIAMNNDDYDLRKRLWKLLKKYGKNIVAVAIIVENNSEIPVARIKQHYRLGEIIIPRELQLLLFGDKGESEEYNDCYACDC